MDLNNLGMEVKNNPLHKCKTKPSWNRRSDKKFCTNEVCLAFKTQSLLQKFDAFRSEKSTFFFILLARIYLSLSDENYNGFANYGKLKFLRRENRFSAQTKAHF